MKPRSFGVAFLLTFSIVYAVDKLIFLEDFLGKLPGTVLEAHLCWSRDQNAQLQKQLIRNRVMYAIFPDHTYKASNFSKIFLADMNCDFFDAFIHDTFERKLYRFHNKWLIFGNIADLRAKRIYFPVNSYILLISESAEKTLVIQALYQLKNDSNYFENLVGIWSEDKHFLVFNELTFIKNRTNFHGMPLKVTYVVTDNNSLDHRSIFDNRNKHIDKATKINYLMYEYFIHIWNMSHEKIVTNEWGLEFHPTKLYYKGLLGDLCHERADAAGTVMFTPSERLKYFRFLVSTAKEMSLYFIFRSPPLPYAHNLFALPFDNNIWISCGVVLIICCLVIWTIMTWESNVESFAATRQIHNENAATFMDIVMMQIGVVCQMEYFHEPRSTAGKIATFSLLLGFSYIYNAFCARIVILLQATANNLHDYKALYEAKMDMGVEATSYNMYYFSTPNSRTNEEYRKLIYENKIAPKSNFLQATDGMKLVQNSYFAFHVELTTASDLILATFSNQEKCAVRKVKSIYKEDKPYLASPVNSTITEYLMIGFHRLFETGVHSRENRRRFTKLPPCLGRSSLFLSVGLKECYFAIEIFIIGVMLSLLIFILELISNVYLKNRQRRTINATSATW